MASYKDVKEIYTDIKKDKGMMIMLKILAGVLIVLVCNITYKSIFEPVNLFGIELNKNKIKHDTLRTTIHDTITIPLSNDLGKEKENTKKNQDVKADVKSVNQKGGQTANQINNN